MILENGLALAYIGDAIYELRVREHLLNSGFTKVNDMHKRATDFTSASGQSLVVDYLMDKLEIDELEMYKRGRNSGGTHKPKNASLNTYRKATGFESLIGYLYLEKKLDRMEELIKEAIDLIEKEIPKKDIYL